MSLLSSANTMKQMRTTINRLDVNALKASVGTTAKWNFVYLTSNTGASLSASAVKPGGIALLSLTGSTSNTIPFFTGNTATDINKTTLSNYGKTLVDDTNASVARGTLGIHAGNTGFTPAAGITDTNVQGAIQSAAGRAVAMALVLG